MPTLAEQAIEALNAVHWRHPAFRAAHAKGTLCRGTFTATPEAARLTRAAHLQGSPVDVTVRFSNGSGDPTAADSKPDGRGMAAKFYLPDGSRTDIVAVTLPAFFARTPEDFLAFTRVLASAPLTRAWRLLAYVATHRSALPAVRAGASLKPIPSYANCRYNALHAYRWIDAEGTGRHIRYSWLPQAGEASLPSREAKLLDPDYLQSEIVERVGREPVRFTLQLQIADQGDPVDDATAIWPDDRETVTAGTLELTEVETSREEGDDVLVFDPTRVTNGIELSADPILHFRRHAYSVSVEQRSGVAPPPDVAAQG
jgi:catalase